MHLNELKRTAAARLTSYGTSRDQVARSSHRVAVEQPTEQPSVRALADIGEPQRQVDEDQDHDDEGPRPDSYCVGRHSLPAYGHPEGTSGSAWFELRGHMIYPADGPPRTRAGPPVSSCGSPRRPASVSRRPTAPPCV
jgi:hypothetical protein